MGNSNNLASVAVSEADKIKAINKELSKFYLKYEDLPARTQQYLLRAEDFFIDQLDELNKTFSTFKSVDFTVDAFCQYAGIARSTIYKKNSNGMKSYKAVIDFINSKSPNCEQIRLRLMRDYIRTSTTDQKLLNSLLAKEVERMQIKRELEDKNEQIKSLEAQLQAYKKQLQNLKFMS